jgi:hypothetical protein
LRASLFFCKCFTFFYQKPARCILADTGLPKMQTGQLKYYQHQS